VHSSLWRIRLAAKENLFVDRFHRTVTLHCGFLLLVIFSSFSCFLSIFGFIRAAYKFLNEMP